MREYRGRSIDNDEWAYGSLLSKDGRSYIVCDCETMCDDGENTDLYAVKWYEVCPETVGQYIGRKDRNGIEIYKGDIVRFKDNWEGADESLPEKIGHVGFSDASFRIERAAMNHYRWMDYDCEVIGNRWDNPDLLEVA